MDGSVDELHYHYLALLDAAKKVVAQIAQCRVRQGDRSLKLEDVEGYEDLGNAVLDLEKLQ